jgi:predicted nucleic acid-binding protein
VGDTLRFLALLRGLPIQVVTGDVFSLPELASLAREFGLSAYDASYLRLAIDNGVPIATLDVRLRDAASRAGVALWFPGQGA